MSKSPSRSRAKPKEQLKAKASVADVVSLGKTQLVTQQKGTKMSEARSIIEYDTDLSEAEAPVPLPKGDYTAEIRAAEIKTSGKGNEYVNVTFFIDADQYPADYTEGNPDGTVLTYGRLSPENTTRARYGMKKFCESIGSELGKSLDLNAWLGKTAVVVVVQEEYEGENRAKISKVKEA